MFWNGSTLVSTHLETWLRTHLWKRSFVLVVVRVGVLRTARKEQCHLFFLLLFIQICWFPCVLGTEIRDLLSRASLFKDQKECNSNETFFCQWSVLFMKVIPVQNLLLSHLQRNRVMVIVLAVKVTNVCLQTRNSQKIPKTNILTTETLGVEATKFLPSTGGFLLLVRWRVGL